MTAAMKKLIGHGVEISVMRTGGKKLIVKCQLPADVMTAVDACNAGMCEGCGWDVKSHPQLQLKDHSVSLCWKWFRRRFCSELKRDDVL